MSGTHPLASLVDPEVLLQVLESLGSGVILVDLGRIIRFVNKKAEALTGFTREELIGASPKDVLFTHVTPGECEFEALLSSGACEFDSLLRKKDGSTFFAHIIANTLRIKGAPQGIVINFVDITERKELEKRLHLASITDHLTQLYNRRYLEDFLKREMALAERYGTPFSLILLDLDNFKVINDVYGHEAGDGVLVAIARVLKENLRGADLAGRWGGEEFLIVLPNTSFEDALKVAEKLRNLICHLKVPPIEGITGSFGVAQYQPGESIEETLKRADLALYKAKAEGKNCVIVF